ncbi:thioredoxin-disulfide reductase [Alkalibacter saccharofermentans]|uniref:Thioredoxin reductase n=1 Tax=Alkalibacter saccharofermentans DSM 14828 TaxID=1120975 RepID=A0A1M4V1F6_9FIRM|nr:thioredoxin-disulfide reductase [Alkalibacter saccharofermentans]SHE62730.1 thioredoxin reductase (NADPH) [Alkalibacter saccharofermentans DSM 14828]
MKTYDLVIIGGGPAGLSAGLYASRAKLKNIVLEKGDAGGQLATTNDIDNYPGSAENTNGPALSQRMKDQCVEFGSEFAKEELLSIEKKDKLFYLKTDKNEYEAKSVVIATGSNPKEIGCKGEKEFRGMGVSYCATCDGFFFKDLTVAVIGGGDSALEEGMFLTKLAKKVYVVHRRDEFRAAKSIQEKAFANSKMEFIYDSVVEEIKGDGVVNGITLKNVKTGELTNLSVDGVFVFVGYKPDSTLFEDMVEIDEIGFIIGDEEMKTKMEGIFVAGDVRQKMLKQVITAAADGAIAAVSAEKYIARVFE